MATAGHLDRRTFLSLLVAGGAAACTAGTESARPTGSGPAAAASPGGSFPALDADPFSLGVASGDPLPDSVILWTRLAPRPTEGGGMPDVPVEVTWEVATDDAFSRVVASGTTVAEPRLAHSVHVDAAGLAAGTWYSYRFRAGPWTSPPGRTRTTPPADADPATVPLRFAFGSCQNYTDGHYGAYAHLVADRPDLMVWLGDYIYEEAIDLNRVTRGVPGTVRGAQSIPTATTLGTYRDRYALYKTDTRLQAAHAACPWITIWDDHEVANNYAGDHSQGNDEPEAFRRRRAAAYQAFYEHQPVRLDAPAGPDYRIERTTSWGRLATFYALDERQHRTDQACNAPEDLGERCAETFAEDRTLLGAQQEAWLYERLDASSSTWDILANEVMLTPMPLLATLSNLDQWDGYPAARKRLLDRIAARRDAGVLVLTGDIHLFATGDVHADPEDAASPIVATEFVGGSITSGFPEMFANAAQTVISRLPQIRYVNTTLHGYALCDLTATTATVRYRSVPVTSPDGDVTTIASFRVDAGSPGARLVPA